jgi:hypothetical protein
MREDNLAYLDLYQSKQLPIMYGKKTPGSATARVYSDLFIPLNRRRGPMFTKVNFKSLANKEKTEKFLIV